MKKRNKIKAAILAATAASLVVCNAQAGSTKTCDSALTCEHLKTECNAANGSYGGYTQGQKQWGICWFPIAVKLG